MVILHVKHKDQSQFLYKTSLTTIVDEVITKITAIYNGRLKIYRICSEMDELAKYGTLYPPEILGLTSEQVEELKLTDTWGEKCIPSGGFQLEKDPIGRRNGKQPRKEMQDVLKKAIEEAKRMIDMKLTVETAQPSLDMKRVQEAINLLRGAVTIVYPMRLPPHDTIRMELENVEDLSGTQASLEVIDPLTAQLWFCGKELYRGKSLSDYVGRIDSCKVIVKLSRRGDGPPSREPVFTENQRKEFMMHAYRRQEELKKLETDDDDTYFNSEWADGSNLKKSFHGLTNISWRPGQK